MGNYKKICVFDPKKKQWISTITGYKVSEKTAKRYNNAYIKYRKQGLKQSEITVNMLHGNPLRYKKGKGKEKQTKKVRTVLDKKRLQYLKTKNIKGQIIYRHPTLGVISKKTVKKASIDRQKWLGGQLYLYRLNKMEDWVYHIIYYNINKIFYNLHQFQMWRIQHEPRLWAIADSLPRLLRQYPLGKRPHHWGRITNRRFSAGYQSPETGGYFGQTRANNTRYIRSEVTKVLDDFENFLGSSAYTSVKLITIGFFVYNVYDERYSFTKIRKGVENIQPSD